jgi:hypothetical protein
MLHLTHEGRGAVRLVLLLLLACGGAPKGLPLGKAVEVEVGKDYRFAGGLEVAVKEIAMAFGESEPGKDFHALHAKVEARFAGGSETLELWEGKPRDWKGYRLAITSTGFTYGGPGRGTLEVTKP